MSQKKNEVWQSLFYSAQRIDTLIMTISGAGIYVSLESMKYMNTNEIVIPCLLKCAGFGFTTAILLNFISQYCSYKTHAADYIIELIKGQSAKERKEQEGAIASSDKSARIYSIINDWLNIISAVIMFGSIFTLVYILSITF